MQNVHTIKQCHQRYSAVLPAEKVVASPLELQLPNNEIQRKAFPIRMLGRNLGLDTGLSELLRGLPQSLLLHFGQRLKTRRHNFCLPHCFQFFIQKYLHNGGNKSNGSRLAYVLVLHHCRTFAKGNLQQLKFVRSYI